MPTIDVGKVPQGARALEHYAAALFQAAGYYVETNVEETDGGDSVLELDLVATDYHDGKNDTLLGEAKSGGWGYGEVFKLAGWMSYLGIDKGLVICPGSTLRRDAATVRARAQALSIEILDLGDFSDVLPAFNDLGIREVADESAVWIWRYSYWIEAVLFDTLRRRAKSQLDRPGLQTAVKLRRVINDEIFFQPDVTSRLHNLYDEYKDHPKLTLAVAREAEGRGFDPAANSDSPRLTRALREGEKKDAFLQSCMYLEHRARLAVMKAAVDLSIESGGDPWSTRGTSAWGRILRFTLPDSFRTGMTALMAEPHFHLYPKFWQAYLWSWGGFYLADRAGEEFEAMSVETGIPPEHIPNALDAFNKLFPTPRGWEWSKSNASWKQVKMMPWPFRGLGAARRLHLYDVEQYHELGFLDRTDWDLAAWHNNFVHLLEGTENALR